MELEAGKRYQVDVEASTTGRGTLTDPYLLYISNAAGTSISGTTDDDGGVGNNARSIFTPTADGAHFVQVQSSVDDREGRGTYTLSVIYLGANGASEADTDFPVDNTTTGRVEVGGSATGNLHRFGDQDWFRVELEAGKRYQVDLEGVPTGRGTLCCPNLISIVYDANSINVPQDNDGGVGGNDRVVFTPTADGTYFLWVTGSISGTYTLSVRDVTPQNVEGATDLAGNATTTGEV